MAKSGISTESAGSKPKPPSPRARTLALAVATIAAASGGSAYEVLRQPDAPIPSSNASGDASASASNVVDLPPIVTNLTAPHDVWIRLESSIVIDPKTTPNPDVMAGEIAADILAYLRTLALRDVEGPVGLENLRQDLADRAAVRSEGKASALLIRTLVVQ